MKSVDQQYAKVAYKCVEAQAGAKDVAKAKEYNSLCRSFASMVLLNGLRLTVAFYQAKGKSSERSEELKAHAQYLSDIAKALGFNDWNAALSHENSSKYRLMTTNALRASIWFKRYAEALFEDGD